MIFFRQFLGRDVNSVSVSGVARTVRVVSDRDTLEEQSWCGTVTNDPREGQTLPCCGVSRLTIDRM